MPEEILKTKSGFTYTRRSIHLCEDDELQERTLILPAEGRVVRNVEELGDFDRELVELYGVFVRPLFIPEFPPMAKVNFVLVKGIGPHVRTRQPMFFHSEQETVN